MQDPLTKDRVLKLLDEFTESYVRAWENIYSRDRIGAFKWDMLNLRSKIEKELTDG